MTINCRSFTPKEISRIMGLFLYDYLGTYTYDDGRTRKAVTVGKPNDNAKVTGLELVVPKMADVVRNYQEWSFYLLDRSDDDPDLLFNVYLFLKSNLVLINKVIYLESREELGNYDQLCIILDNGKLAILSAKVDAFNNDGSTGILF